MKSIILLFELFLNQNNPKLFQRLNVGISQESFKSKMNTIGIGFEIDIFQLYEWRNGIKDPNSLDEMFYCGVFMPIDTSIEVYDKLSIKDTLWEKKFFPLFSNYAGEFILIDIDSKSKGYKKIFIFSPLMYSQPVIIYDNLYSMMHSVVECYKTKAYQFENGQLLIDFDILYNVCKGNNKQSKFWND